MKFHSRGDVDQDNGCPEVGWGQQMGSEDDQPTQRRADDGGGTVGADVSSYRDQIGHKPFDVILSARVPVAVAVTSCVVGDDGVAVGIESTGGGGPRVTVLAAAMEQQHDGVSRGVPVAIGHESDPVAGADALSANCHVVRCGRPL